MYSNNHGSLSLHFRPRSLLLRFPPLSLELPPPTNPHRFLPGLPFGANPNISNSCINTYSTIIIYVYPLLLETPTTLLVEVGSLTNTDAAVYAAVSGDEVLSEETESVASAGDLAAAALSSASLVASSITLSEVLPASVAASIRLYMSASAASIQRPRSVRRSSSSSLAAAASVAFYSSVKDPANLKQSEM